MAATSFLECVATVAAEERERARAAGGDAELIDIAYWSRISQGAISRFENHLSQPRELDRLLWAYSKVTGVPAAQILREAIERWEAQGMDPDGEITPPDTPQGPAAEAADAAEALAERARRTRDDTAGGRRGQRRRPA